MNILIRVEFTPDLHTYLKFNQYESARRLRILRIFAGFLVAIFLCAPLAPFEGAPGVAKRYLDSAGVLILPALVFVLLPLNVFVSALKRWKSTADLREHRVFEFSDSGLTIVGGTSQGSTAWVNIVRAERIGKTILLYNGQRQAFLIPESAFRDRQQAETLKALLRQKIANCKGLG